MFHRQTLFILGAGSSVEVGFPPSKNFADSIGKWMDIRFERGNIYVGNGDQDLFESVTRGRTRDYDPYLDAAWTIRDGIGFAQSIDDFLDLHRTNAYVNLYGKAAIVKAILQAERQSHLYFGGTSGIETFQPEKFAQTWFVKFMFMLGRNVPRESVLSIFNRVAFITFNYDRCLEYFLFHALQNLYALDDRVAQSVLSNLDIVHPYGVVDPTVSFGSSRANYIELANNIKTYSEQVSDKAVTDKIDEQIQKADAIVFLGFGYHNQNLRILQPSVRQPNKLIYGTAFGFSHPDQGEISRQLATLLAPSQLNLEAVKCAALFDSYAKTLTGAP